MKKRAFTLIELMIVLAVIAILAVVLVPRAGIFKSNAKNAGVVTNVNTVRAYLETKTGANFLETEGDLEKALENAFPTSATGDNALTNPFDNSVGYNSTDNSGAIHVGTGNPSNGDVVVIHGSNGYTVYGIDNSGTKVNEVTITR
ncbi:type II secretion system protein [Clostridium thermarum]|uniref:type II secretion system protein n=1 Tax=Clostridium thermarum TaxID=1716543 RepID=UPI0013D7B1D2|nr:type II secretion system protein [Clostridium thermarum]